MACTGGFDRYDQFCTSYGCFSRVFRDDVENPPPSLALTGLTLFPDPRVPSEVRDVFCGPFGCAGPLPQMPSRAPVSLGCTGQRPFQ